MAAVANGDEAALAALIDRYAAGVHAYLVRHSGNRDDADDLLQETWMRVARSAKGFDTARRFRSWIYGIATNLARDLFRRRMTKQRALRTLAMNPPAKPGADSADRGELRERVANLPENMRAVLLLRYYEGMNEAEMADALEIPRGTVKSRLHAALRELRGGYGVSN
ncbi:MAG TPA: RNA polymerase sigma factor [Myxococcota bacterium]